LGEEGEVGSGEGNIKKEKENENVFNLERSR